MFGQRGDGERGRVDRKEVGMTGWVMLAAQIVIQAMRDCEAKGKRTAEFDPGTKHYQKLAAQWQAIRWLRYSPQCRGLQADLGWEAFTGDDLIERARSGEIDWRIVAIMRRSV